MDGTRDPGEEAGLLGGQPPPPIATFGETALAETAFGETAAPLSGPDDEPGPEGLTVVHYHFPVEIEVRATPEAPDPVAAARLALRWLTEGLHAL